jgi:putative acetyltransferase
MVQDYFSVRPERPDDAPAVRTVLERAFPTTAEAGLVDRLRRGGDLVLALVAVGGAGAIVGHVAFSRLRVGDVGAEAPAVGLAPLAVAEGHRRGGVGAALIRTGLTRLTEMQEGLVFVLGDPAYFSRFGFSVEAARPFAHDYAGGYFMALRLSPTAPHGGMIRYPAAFSAL